jgi:hypothetical protein
MNVTKFTTIHVTAGATVRAIETVTVNATVQLL